MSEPAKTPAPSAAEHAYPPPVIQYPPGAYTGPYPPPPPPGGAPYPPYFYPPPAEAAHGENGQPAMPPGTYMMLAPPNLVYVTTPPGQPFPSPSASAAQPASSRPKRKQVKMACTNCAAACKRCDEQRPCERCQKYGIADNCVDGQRKERKKGIKRGPYKRKNKGGPDSPGYSGEWTPGTQPPPPTASTAAAAAMHAAVANQLPPEAAGYYPPIFYPPPHPYLAHAPDGPPGAPDGQPAQPPMVQYYIHPGAGYPPYGHYPAMYPHPPPPHPGAPPPPGTPGAPPPPPGSAEQAAAQQQQQQPTTVNPADTSKKDPELPDTNGIEPSTNGKKRSKSSKGEHGKSKKLKTGRTKDKEAGGGTAAQLHEGHASGPIVAAAVGAAADSAINPALA